MTKMTFNLVDGNIDIKLILDFLAYHQTSIVMGLREGKIISASFN